jgi:hypothetical protein
MPSRTAGPGRMSGHGKEVSMLDALAKAVSAVGISDPIGTSFAPAAARQFSPESPDVARLESITASARHAREFGGCALAPYCSLSAKLPVCCFEVTGPGGFDGTEGCDPSGWSADHRLHHPERHREELPGGPGAYSAGGDEPGECATTRSAGSGRGLLRDRAGALRGVLLSGGPVLSVGGRAAESPLRGLSGRHPRRSLPPVIPRRRTAGGSPQPFRHAASPAWPR